MTTAAAQQTWSDVWKLYLENRDVFTAVVVSLRAKGFAIDDVAAQDYVHEFLVERAPAAIATFQPQRGDLKGWLYVVFKRFVTGTFRDRARRERLLKEYAFKASGDTLPDGELPVDLDALQRAMKELPAAQQNALNAFLSAPEHSIREVARTIGLSRWRASALILGAIETLATRFGSAEAIPRPRTAAEWTESLRH